ncbi:MULTISPECIES: anti-sigma factor domain-containing protein [Cyanophyceae]|uniref:Regulator of SigK n=1 Tax=Leptolyngbya subtilissima DQ-A4 TaxID=2933933 RepID=A0ABV0K744_9CYAN|nr:anti-sigma factor [Nodosilinea sp. FACHB-141]MBD2114658.1 anti-sigma factor [Nodosilinea sp. FACHB-141]
MTSPPLPDNWRSLLAGYVLDDLTAEEAAQVEQWLEQYPEVATELAALQATWGSLALGPTPVAPPPDLRDRTLAAALAAAAPVAVSAAAEPEPTTSADVLVPSQLPSTAPVVRRRFPWGRVGLACGWAATALALAFTLQENQRLRLALRQTEAVVASFSQPANRLYTLAGTDAEPQANARLVVNPADQTALIVTTDLPPLDDDQVYRLWALADSDPVFCGEFNPATAEDTNQWALPDAACGTAPVQMLITAERADDPPVPAGDLVLQSES